MTFQLRIIDWEKGTEKNRRDEGNVGKDEGGGRRKREKANKSKERKRER